MWMLFIYVNKKPYNSMGIRGSLEEIFEQARKEIEEHIQPQNPRADIELKLSMYL